MANAKSRGFKSEFGVSSNRTERFLSVFHNSPAISKNNPTSFNLESGSNNRITTNALGLSDKPEPPAASKNSKFLSKAIKHKTKEPLLRAVKTRLFCRENYYLDIDPATCKIYGVPKKEIDDELKQREAVVLPQKTSNKYAHLGSSSKNSNNHQKENIKNLTPSSEVLETIMNQKPEAVPAELHITSEKSSPDDILPSSRLSKNFPSGSTPAGNDPTAGASNSSRLRGLFYLIPVGLRIVAIQHVDTGLYIAMCPDGRAYPCEMFTSECKFKEVCVEQTYVTYSQTIEKVSKRQQNQNMPIPDQKKMTKMLYLGINPKGGIIKGTKCTDKETKKLKYATHFLPQPISCVMMREPSSYEVIGGPLRVQGQGLDENNNFSHAAPKRMSKVSANLLDVE